MDAQEQPPIMQGKERARFTPLFLESLSKGSLVLGPMNNLGYLNISATLRKRTSIIDQQRAHHAGDVEADYL
jgi:hypothetical protein